MADDKWCLLQDVVLLDERLDMNVVRERTEIGGNECAGGAERRCWVLSWENDHCGRPVLGGVALITFLS